MKNSSRKSMAGAISLLLIFLSSTSNLFAQDYPDEIIDTTGISELMLLIL